MVPNAQKKGKYPILGIRAVNQVPCPLLLTSNLSYQYIHIKDVDWIFLLIQKPEIEISYEYDRICYILLWSLAKNDATF